MGVSDGFNTVVNAYNLKLKREQVRMEAAKTKAQLYQQGFDEEGNPTDLAIAQRDITTKQLKQQQQQLEFLQKYIKKKDTHDVINNAIATGNWDSVNVLFDIHPDLKDVWHVKQVRNINFNNDTDINLLKQYGLPEDKIAQLQKDPIQAKKFMQTHFIAIDLTGKTYIKDAKKVAAVAGVAPGSFEVYDMAFKNKLQSLSDTVEAQKGVYGQNRANINLIQTKVKKVNSDINLNNEKENYYEALASKAKTDEEKSKLQMKGVMYDNLMKQIKAGDMVDKEKVMNNLPTLIDTIVDYNPNKFKPEDRNIIFKQAKTIQGDKTPPESMQNRITGTMTAIKTGKQLLDFIDKQKVDVNAINKLNRAIISALPEHWTKLTPEQRKEALKRVKIDAAMGEWATKYVQAISGAAVTDNEFTRHFRDAFGGKTFTNTDTIKAAFSTYLTSLEHNLDQDINNIAGNYPYTALTYKDRLYKDIKKKPKKSLGEIFGSNK